VGTVSRASGAPLYDQLIKIFESKMSSGEWAVGERLPSERELCEVFSVSRITVRRAIAEAAARGLVERVHGVGNFVASPKMRQSLRDVTSFGVSLAADGLLASTQILDERTEISDFSIAGVLGVPVASSVQYLQIRGLGGDVPLVIYDSFLPADTGAAVLAEARRLVDTGTAFTTVDIHRNSLTDPLVRIEQTFEAVVADEATAALLQVDPGWPVFRIESVLRAETRVLEYRIARYRGDRYKFAIERSAL